MVGRPISKTRKARIDANTRKEVMDRAIEVYHAEQKKANAKERKGFRTVCQTVEREHWEATKTTVKLSHSTLCRLVQGGKTKAERAAERGWLNEEEGALVAEHAAEMARKGTALNHKRLKELVDNACRVKYGDVFPKEGVGKMWTYRFAEKHMDNLKLINSRCAHHTSSS